MTKSQGRRHQKLAGYYDHQFQVTTKNKARRAKKRADKKARWIKTGRKKNGKPVKTT